MPPVPAVVSIGTFDGVHIGHQAILAELRRQATSRQLESIVYTFGLPPKVQTAQLTERFLLLPEEIKVRLLRRYVHRVVQARLEEVRDLPPDRFVAEILDDRLKAAAVVVGPTFRFGRQRAGTPEDLRTLGEHRGVSVIVVPPIVAGVSAVSSTRIRSLLAHGRVTDATALLGRPPILFGHVHPGDRVGHELGYPTANLRVDPPILLPAPGIYAVHAFLSHTAAPSAAPGLLYVGRRPTLRAEQVDMRCEVHLLAPPERDLYGQSMEVHLLDWLRGDRAFASMEELRVQIARDVNRAREHFPHLPSPRSPIGS